MEQASEGPGGALQAKGDRQEALEACAQSYPPQRCPAGQDVWGVDDLQPPPLPRMAPLLEGLGLQVIPELGLEHSPPEDAVPCGAFSAPGFSHQDEPQRLQGPFIPLQPWKHQEKVGVGVRACPLL